MKLYALRSGALIKDYMAEPVERTLVDKRILVPPARPESNPLLNVLQRRGAEVLEFPKLIIALPVNYDSMDDAIRHLDRFDHIIFSGSNCVVNFIKRFNKHTIDRAVLGGLNITAIGHGAVSALKKEGMEINYVPRIHTSQEIIEGLGAIAGSSFLLVRVEGASRSLPERLRGLGAKVREVEGYRMIVDADGDAAGKVFGRKLDAAALTNPTAVRFLIKGADRVGLNLRELLRGVTVAAVGPATAEAARNCGLTPGIVSKGHIANLINSLIEIFGAG